MDKTKYAGADGSGSEEELQRLRRQLKNAKSKLSVAVEQANTAKEFNRQILSSTSWKITSPIRRIRTLMGASPPVDVQGLDGESGLESELVKAGPEEESLLPKVLPESMFLQSATQAERSNNRCEILSLDQGMEGLVPDGYRLPHAESMFDPVATYFGKDSSPPRIAFLGTLELARELAFEAAVTVLSEASWQTQLASSNFSMLLIEPVWHVGNRQWRGCMSKHGKARASVEALLEKARFRGIPTVLWFRAPAGDIEHFGWIAERVDKAYAAVSDAARSLSDVSGKPVSVLAPAIQPAVHHPLRSWTQLSAPEFRQRVLYDGWLDLLEGAADDPLVRHFKESRLLVAESEWEFGGPRLNDAPEFKLNAAGCLSKLGKAALARMVGAEIFRDSPLVPEWRKQQMMLRSIACGSIVSDSAGGDIQWGGLPLRGDAVQSRLEGMFANPLEMARTRHIAFRDVFSNHCLADRLNRVSADLGLDVHFGRKPATVACLLVTMRPQLLQHCLDRFRADLYPHKELVVVLHGRDASLKEARSLVRAGERISIFQLGKEQSLGSCLNFAAGQSDAEYWAKFDDDDIYGPNYLSDVMLYRRGLDFSLGGKTAAFIYSEADDEIRWDAQYAADRAWQLRRARNKERIHVAGGTLIGKREVLEAVPFSATRRRGSDTDFLRRADAEGVNFAAFDFFNFALFRSGAEGFHTWSSSMDAIKERTQGVGSGSQLGAVVCI